MSLLLDALRRAEEARRAKEAADSGIPVDTTATAGNTSRAQPKAAAPTLELAIDEAASFAPSKSPVIETNRMASTPVTRGGLALEAIPAPVAVQPSAPPVLRTQRTANIPEAATPKEATPRDVARNVFAAKQSSLQSVSGSGKRKWILPVVAGALVLLSAGSWYVWNEVNRASLPMTARAPSQQSATLPRAAPNTGQIGSKPAAAVETKETKIAEAPIPALLPPPAPDAPAPTIPIASRVGAEKPLTARETLAQKLRDAPVPKEAPTGLKLARSMEPAKINPDLAAAYQSLLNGDYAVAQKFYAKVASAEPLNVDAQLGLAIAAARIGDKASAMQHYRQVLALDPRNGLAIMGMVAINDGAQPAALEIELKTLIGRNPDAAPLHFALGNAYAADRRWTEAQQAYFDAFRIDSANPDYLFNLAVSLDQLRQSKLALDYYRKAEALSISRGGGQFDRSIVAKRIRELSTEAGHGN